MFNIIMRVIKNNIKGLVMWTLALSLTIFFMAFLFDSMGTEMSQSLELMPESMLKAFGMNSIAIGSLEATYSEGYIIVILMGSMYIAYLGASTLVREEDEGSIEYLMCKPYNRFEIFFSKFIALIIIILIMNMFIAAATILGALIFGEDNYSTKAIYLMAFAPCILHLTFGSLCFGIASFIKKNRQAVSLSIGIVCAFYMISIIRGLSDKLDFLKRISLFDYVSTNVVAGDKYIEPINLIIMFAIMIVSVIVGCIYYNKKDF